MSFFIGKRVRVTKLLIGTPNVGLGEADSLFCSCGSMMFPKDGKYVCNACGAVEDIGNNSQVFKTESKDKETTVIKENVATLPKTRIQCPECGHTEAYYVIRQTRAADEPETRIYRCCKCNHSWREY